jgi:hypothetical protein
VIERIGRRLRQGLRGLLAFAQPVDFAAAQAILSPELMRLFRRMRRGEQTHSLRVMASLRGQGHREADLLAAALLHDCGKSRYPFSLFERTLVVVMRRLAPETYHRLASSDPAGFARPFVIAAQHPEWSAEDMAAAGASARAVELARRHQAKVDNPRTETDRLLMALQAADDEN